MDQLLSGIPGQIQITIRDSAGVLFDLDADPDVEVFDGGGTSVLTGSAAHATTGVYVFDVPSVNTQKLDTYTATWTGAIASAASVFTTHFEVVGGFYFSIAEARAFDGGKLADETAYPTSDLVEAREAVEEYCERPSQAGIAFVPRGKRATLDGSDSQRLLLKDMFVRELYSISRSGTTLTVSDYDVYATEGMLYSAGGFVRGNLNYALHYAYGLDECPSEVKRIALKLLVQRMTEESETPAATREVIDRYEIDYATSGTLTASENDTLASYRVPVLG